MVRLKDWAAALTRIAGRLGRRRSEHSRIVQLELQLDARTAELERISATLRDEIARHASIVQELKLQKEVAEDACRARTTFLANISHEIRTSLNGIVGITSLLRETPLNPEQSDGVRALGQASEALYRITNDILDLSKIESGRLTLERTDFKLTELLQGALALHSGAATRKGLRLRLELDGAVPRHVKGDPVRLQQVVVNLLNNAVKFTPSGHVVLRVRLDATLHRRARLRFEVIDTGIGIAESVQPSLFQPFVQAANSTSRQYGGTGLGLAICKHLVEMMRGRIGLKSVVGEGSTFWFTIELDHAESLTTESRTGVQPSRVHAEIVPSLLELHYTRDPASDSNR